jgi:proteasome assembly chaperone (PAC2) family protein
MVDRNDMQNEISKLSQTSTNLLLDNILKKHNVKLDKSSLSNEQRSQIKKLVQDLQESFQKLQKQEKK